MSFCEQLWLYWEPRSTDVFDASRRGKKKLESSRDNVKARTVVGRGEKEERAW